MHTHSQKLERWLGADQVEKISKSMLNWYGPPIAIGNTEGFVFAMKGGNFCGAIKGGGFASLTDFAEQRVKRVLRNASRRQMYNLNAGFTSLSDLISEATTGGKSQMLPFTKAGVAGVAARSNTLWGVGAVPVVGAAAGTSGTGARCTRTTAGALGQANAGVSDQLHLTTCTVQASVAGQMLLMYDRLWHMTHNMLTTPINVDTLNQPNRYITATTAPGNFITEEVTTVLPAATPTITYTYVDDAGNAAAAGSALSTIASAAAVGTIAYTAPSWFYPLSAGDTGVRSITVRTLSAGMASGVCSTVIGHPLMFVPVPLANTPVIIDGINSAFNLQRVYDDACISFLEIAKSATTATNWWGAVNMVSG